ncbi:MAG: sigma-70 family RNA polymerase sigma factor [bacterium]|nr:sigma-70 family RNA polymerase sigma factor [bacterium]
MQAGKSDEWLMGQVALGSRDHLTPLVRRYSSPLLTFIRRMVGDHHQSEELFQETFFRVWKKRRQYKLNHAFRSWLFAIAANLCKSDYRKKRLSAVSLDASAPPFDEDDTPAESAERSETAQQVATAITQLPAAQRSVVVLRIYNGLSYAEIAEIEQRNEGAVRSNMHHALKGLRDSLSAIKQQIH